MRVIIADDAVLLREGLARLLAELGIHTVAQAGDAEQLLEASLVHSPDVAIIDIRMPPTWTDEGIRVAAELRTRQPAPGILLLSQHLDVGAAVALSRTGHGGVGYLLKERVADSGELASALERIAAGHTVWDPEVVTQLLNRGKADRLDSLTTRERDVLARMAEGRSNIAIARQLTVTGRTVESHVTAIFDKLDLNPDGDDHRRVLAVRTWLAAPRTTIEQPW